MVDPDRRLHHRPRFIRDGNSTVRSVFVVRLLPSWLGIFAHRRQCRRHVLLERILRLRLSARYPDLLDLGNMIQPWSKRNDVALALEETSEIACVNANQIWSEGFKLG